MGFATARIVSSGRWPRIMRMYPRLELDIGWRDLMAALACPQRSLVAVQKLRAWAPVGSAMITALSVRSAFDALLTALDLPPGSKIAMSAISVEAMAEIARAHDLALHPVDIEFSAMLPRGEAVEAALREGARIFVLAHLFGTRAKIDPFVALCRKYNALFVEDCAQAFDGRLPASEADVSLYSFGPIKASTALGGAVAIFRDRQLAWSVDEITKSYDPLSDRWFRRRILKYLFLKAVTYPIPYAALVWLIRVQGKDPDEAITALAKNFSGGDLFTRLRRRPPPRLEWLLERRLRDAKPRQAHSERARQITAAVAAFAPSPGVHAATHNWWLTPVLLEDPAAVMAELRAAGFDASRGATSLCAIRAPGHPTPNADYLLHHVLYLPNSSHLTNRNLERLTECLQASIRRSGHQVAMVASPPALAAENELVAR